MDYMGKNELILEENRTIKPDEIIYNVKINNIYEQNIGKLRCVIVKSEKNLHIEWIKLNSSKPKIPIQLSKILILYVILLHIKYIKTLTLTASPGGNDKTKIGSEYCLMCFYQQLGFEPVNYETKEIVKKCYEKLKKMKPDYHNYLSMCTLCECQKNNITFTDIDITQLQVDMKALLSKMYRIFYQLYYQICEN
jgi:hypothetical protein